MSDLAPLKQKKKPVAGKIIANPAAESPMPDHSWYKLNPHITLACFVECMKRLYSIIEGKNKSYSKIDPFVKVTMDGHFGKDKYELHRKMAEIEKATTMAWGDFHQCLMGSFKDWSNFKTGHDTGCDIGKEDNSCVAEIKNNTNTMNSSSKESVLAKLKKQVVLGKRALLIIVNGDIKKKTDSNGIEWISGKDFYTEVSDSPTFMDDLLKTVEECFQRFKTFEELESVLESA